LLNYIKGEALIIYLFIYSLIIVIWYPLKNIFKRINTLKEEELKANRFKRNYPIFKTFLVSNRKYDLPQTPILLGAATAQLKIAIITSPYCNFCSEPHYILKDILKRYDENVSVNIIYNVNLKKT